MSTEDLSAERAADDLHSAIMNIRAVIPGKLAINDHVVYRMGHRDARHAAAELVQARASSAAAVPARNREADRQRFPDPAFNRWLDERISDVGHTVWDQVGDVFAAWHGWWNREFYITPAPPQAARQGWMPIETAPKDGTRVLVWIADKSYTGHAFAKPWFYSTDGRFGGGAEGYNGDWNITHWMPLPLAPGAAPPQAVPATDAERLLDGLKFAREYARKLPANTGYLNAMNAIESAIHWLSAAPVAVDAAPELPLGAVAQVSAETMEQLRKKALRMLDYGKGRCVQIDANTLLDLLAALRAAGAGSREPQPRLTVRLCSFPESNGKRNWTALLVRTDAAWGGLIGSSGGITVARGELWNRVAYEAERAKFLIGERADEPWILDYGDDIETPDGWPGEKGPPAPRRGIAARGKA
jgi:hypothetical protein